MKRTSIRRAIVPGVVIASLALAGCSGEAEGGDGVDSGDVDSSLTGEVVVDGSSTVFPMSQAAAEFFREVAPEVQVPVGEAGTGGGFERFCNGETDINDASRAIEEDEVAACECRWRDLHRAPGGHRRPDRGRQPEPRGRLPDHRAARRAVEAGLDDHQLEPARPELPRPGDRTVRSRHRLRHLRLPRQRGHRPRRRSEPATRDDYEASEDDNVLVQGVSRAPRVPRATSATPTTSRTRTS